MPWDRRVMRISFDFEADSPNFNTIVMLIQVKSPQGHKIGQTLTVYREDLPIKAVEYLDRALVLAKDEMGAPLAYDE